jgi:glutamine synthetase
MVGSSTNIACPNFIINTIVAEELRQFADELEGKKDFNKALSELIKRTIKEHKRILFNGNNYSKEWEKEAKRRGLLNLKTTVDALPLYAQKKNIELFAKHRVLSESEIYSRSEILLENYSNIIHI